MLTNDELAKIEAWIDAYYDSRDMAKHSLSLVLEELRAERTRTETASAAFRFYGWHHSTCPTWDDTARAEDCDCGFLTAWEEVISAASVLLEEPAP